MTLYNDSYLMHYGVLGMKWGVRRYQNKDGSRTSMGKRIRSKMEKRIRSEMSERKTRRGIRKDRRTANKRRSQLSEAELDSRIKRLQKEKQLRELTEAEVSRGSQFTSTLVTKSGAVAAAALVGTAAYLGRALISGEIDLGEMANYIFPNPNKKK